MTTNSGILQVLSARVFTTLPEPEGETVTSEGRHQLTLNAVTMNPVTMNPVTLNSVTLNSVTIEQGTNGASRERHAHDKPRAFAAHVPRDSDSRRRLLLVLVCLCGVLSGVVVARAAGAARSANVSRGCIDR